MTNEKVIKTIRNEWEKNKTKKERKERRNGGGKNRK